MMTADIKKRILETIDQVEAELRLDREAGAETWKAEDLIWRIRQELDKLP